MKENSFYYLMKPIDAGAIDDGREFPTPNPESAANWRKTKDNFQLAADSINEKFPTVFSSVLNSRSFHFISQ